MGFFSHTWHSITNGVSHTWNSTLDYTHHRIIDDNVNRVKKATSAAGRGIVKATKAVVETGSKAVGGTKKWS